MDWFMPPWGYWSAVGGSPTPWSWSHDQAVPAAPETFGQRADLTAVDAVLIQLAYEVIAAESSCARCGAPLGRRLRVVPSAADHPTRTASIVTRCSGWRRHRHTAAVDEASNDLLLGSLHAGRP
jgi:hypothetical protein